MYSFNKTVIVDLFIEDIFKFVHAIYAVVDTEVKTVFFFNR